MRQVRSNKESGFTLIELLVAVSVAAIASILIVTAFVFTYGSVIVEQTRASMIRESQVFLRRMVEDIRISNQIRTNNLITDPNGDTWTTSDPANILIATLPATDSSRDLIYDPVTGYPYQHEVVYFKDDSKNFMYRRLLRNNAATGNVQATTCPSGTAGCPPDIELVSNVDNMLFEFYDVSDIVTTIPEEARSVQITINLDKRVYGKDIKTTNTTRVTLRNEN